MYLHKKTYEIRYTDVDFKDNLKLSALLSMMEQSACLSADELKFGYDVLAPKNIGFILVNSYVKLTRPISLGEQITINTWPVQPKKLIVFRDFEIFVGDEKVGVATTRWCMVDLATFNMLPTSVIFDDLDIVYNNFRSIDFNGWKIPPVSCNDVVYDKLVTYSDYDHYNHVNNTKYADFLLDAIPFEVLEKHNISCAQITYVKQCKRGEVLKFFAENQQDFWVVEGKVGDETRVQFKVQFDV